MLNGIEMLVLYILASFVAGFFLGIIVDAHFQRMEW